MTDLEKNVTYQRLEDQIDWYDRKSQHNQWWYKKLKLTTIILAVSLPLVSAYLLAWVSGVFGVVIAIIEAVQTINQHHDNWFLYRSTCESLKHEKYLYLALAGPYEGVDNPQQVLAERLEKTVSQEHARWVDSKDRQQKARYNGPE